MPESQLHISISHDASEIVVALAGEIDVSNVGELKDAVAELLDTSATDVSFNGSDAKRLVLDMGKVAFCDSQGLGTLVVLNRDAARAGRTLILVNVSDFLGRMLDVTGLKQAFHIRADEGPASPL